MANETRFTGLATGTSLAVSLASAAAVGSLILGGNVYTDKNQVATINNYYGTGSYMSYDEVLCTNTGGLAKYTSCLWQNPSSTLTGALMHLQVDSDAAPTAASITCTTSPNGTNTGTSIIKYLATASGYSVGTNMKTNTGTGTGGRLFMIPPSWYIRCWHSATPGPGLKEQLRIWFNGFYTP